ncbi:MAG TPA: zinc-binding dehydrogenase [Ktedonobacteraceae bacterium]|nr:zinc-binding dehydrogenase [Ktedonobacteraceae bacterium]
MKIIRIYEFGGPEALQVEEIELPVLKPGEVLLQTEAIGVNYTDIVHRRQGGRDEITFPYTPGVEVVGTIVAKAEDAGGAPVGTRVLTLLPQGGYTEYLAVPASLALPVPAGLDAIQAAALPLQGLTAYQIIARFGRLQAGERILIQAAAGGVGTLAIQLARLLGAGQIIATASSQAKLDLALSLGADVGINYTQPAWTRQVLDATDGKGVDLFLEMVGGEGFSENFGCLAPFGRIVMFGAASGQRGRIDPEKLTARCHTVTGYYSGFIGTRPDLFLPDLNKLFQYVLGGQLKLLVNHCFPLHKAAEAHHLMETRQTTGKIILLPATGQ